MPIASVRFEFDVCTYANSQTVQFKYSWSLGDQVSILVRSGEWFVIRNYHISTVFHAHIPVSLRGVHQKRQPPDVEKMVENGESAAACGECNSAGVVAWLHSLHFFLLRLPICISLAFINYRYFSPCNERFSRLLLEVENYRRCDKSGSKRINGREAVVCVSQVWVWRFRRRIRPMITHKHYTYAISSGYQF